MSTKDIINALNDGRYPQARELVLRKIDEQPKNGAFFSMLCFVESKQHNRAAALQAAETAIKLGHINLPILNSFLCPVLCAYGEAALLNQAFEAFARKEPPTREMAELWTEYGFDLSFTKALLRAQTALNKTSSTKMTVLSCCFFMAIEHQSLKETDPEYKLYPMLASKMLEKAEPIKAPQEAFVKALILKMTSKHKMADFLLTPEVRKFDSLDLNVILLDTLVELERWDDIYDYAKTQLSLLDSYNYWQALVKAAVRLGLVTELEEFAARFRGPNVCLAKIDLLVEQKQDPLPAVQIFWQQVGTKPSAPQFLKPYLSQAVVDYLAAVTPRSFTETVNVEKISFMWGSPSPVAKLVQLYRDNLDQLPAEKTDYFIGGDLLLMAALQLMGTTDANRFYKAAVLLEWACENDPHQFHVRLWLVRIYRFLGAFAKATGHFAKLSIRNMQCESLGYLVTTRVASLHPDRKLIRDMLESYASINNIGAYAQATLGRGSFTQLPGMLELAQKMRLSLSRILLEFESIKTERVLRGTVSLANVFNRAPTYSDNRDFTTSFDPCGVASHYCETGPRQGSEWVEAQIAKEQVYLDVIRGRKPLKLAPTASKELTVYEKWNIEVVTSLAGGELKLVAPPALSADSELSWELFHAGYTILETIKVVEDIAAKLKMRVPASIKEEKAAVLERAKAMQTAVQQQGNEKEIVAWASELQIKNSGQALDNIAQTQLRALTQLISALT